MFSTRKANYLVVALVLVFAISNSFAFFARGCQLFPYKLIRFAKRSFSGNSNLRMT